MTASLGQFARADRNFERLYRRHLGDVFRYSLAVLQNAPDAEEVTQATFLNAYRMLESGERPATLRNWLLAIAHDACRERCRPPADESGDEEIADKLVGDGADVRAEDVRRALSQLAFTQRAALVMHELEGRSCAEIADVLGLPVGAVETLIFRARRALRDQLESELTCGEAERAISRQLDGRLSRSEKRALRSHLRACPECAIFARRQRVQRAALKSLEVVPVPASLAWPHGSAGRRSWPRWSWRGRS